MPDPLFELPCPFDIETGTVKLLENSDCDPESLKQQLLSGHYGKPFLIEHDNLLTLYFSLGLVQSTMRLNQPDVLDLTYTQKMMAFLLFYPRPKGLLLLGLGGGSLAKFCYRHLPRADITAVEINPHVVAFREAFRNLVGDKAGYDPSLAQLAHVFDDRVLSLKVRDGGNQIAFAFKNPGFMPRWDNIQSAARDLEKRLGMPFTRYAQLLEKSERRTGLRHRRS